MSLTKKKLIKYFQEKKIHLLNSLIIPYDMEYKLGFVLYSKRFENSVTPHKTTRYIKEVNLNIKSTPVLI